MPDDPPVSDEVKFAVAGGDIGRKFHTAIHMGKHLDLSLGKWIPMANSQQSITPDWLLDRAGTAFLSRPCSQGSQLHSLVVFKNVCV